MLVTNDREIYERAIAFGIYERFDERIGDGIPEGLSGAADGRVQVQDAPTPASAVGRVQLKYYDERCAEIRKALDYFWELLDGVPGIPAPPGEVARQQHGRLV